MNILILSRLMGKSSKKSSTKSSKKQPKDSKKLSKESSKKWSTASSKKPSIGISEKSDVKFHDKANTQTKETIAPLPTYRVRGRDGAFKEANTSSTPKDDTSPLIHKV